MITFLRFTHDSNSMTADALLTQILIEGLITTYQSHETLGKKVIEVVGTNPLGEKSRSKTILAVGLLFFVAVANVMAFASITSASMASLNHFPNCVNGSSLVIFSSSVSFE